MQGDEGINTFYIVTHLVCFLVCIYIPYNMHDIHRYKCRQTANISAQFDDYTI